MSKREDHYAWDHWLPSPLRESLKIKVLTVTMLAILLLGIGTLWYTYWSQIKLNNEKVQQNFSLIADILQNNINRWLTNRQNDILSMSVNPLITRAVHEISTDSKMEASAEAELVQYWQKMCQQYKIYEEIYLVSPSGKILVSTEYGRKNTFRPLDDIIIKPLQTGKTHIETAYLSHKNDPSVAFSVPIKAFNQKDYVAVLVYRLNIDEVLRPLLENRVNLGRTGEIILVDENRRAITGLRSESNSAMYYELNSEPAKRVSQGEDGLWRGVGYNGQEIISVFRFLPATHWGIIIRQETDEILGPARNSLQNSLLLSLGSGMFVMFLLYLWLSRSLRPIADMADVARDISRGDFSKRVQIQNQDEVAVLGKTLNQMAKELGEQFKLQSNRHRVLQSLVSSLCLDELLETVLHTVCRSYGYQVGGIFLVNSLEGTLDGKALYCPGSQLINQRKRMKINEGLEGLAVTTRKVQVLTDLPEDTVYTVDWMNGSSRPACIVQVPLLFGEEVLGVMSLVSLQKTSQREVEELSTLGTLIGVAVNNALSYQRTQDMSARMQDLNEQLAQQNEELNAQSEELQAQTEELLAQNEELQAQSEELQAITEELQEKNDQLQEVTSRKSNFFASMSHELRAPLNAVISFSDVLLDRVVGEINTAQEKYIKEIFRSGQHLLNLIDDLLDFIKTETGQIRLQIRETDPALPLEEALAMVSSEMENKGLRVTPRLEQNKYIVMADQDKLKQIFLNLLTNAVKFTPKGGVITVDARMDNEDLIISITDNGIGIAPEFHEVIFEEFKQAPNTIPGGNGLGLAITKNLLELQGGRIWVDSEEGRGATFFCTVPLVCGEQKLENNETGTEPRETAITGILVRYLPKPVHKGELVKLAETFTKQGGKSPTLLVIDDDPAARKYVVEVLSSKCTVLTADDGSQGLEMILEEQPDILILDLAMPGLDGFQVIEYLSKYYRDIGMTVYISTSRKLTDDEKKRLGGSN